MAIPEAVAPDDQVHTRSFGGDGIAEYCRKQLRDLKFRKVLILGGLVAVLIGGALLILLW